MINEEWLTTIENDNYEVSNLGNVRNKKTQRLLKQSIQNSGYSIVCLSNKGKQKTYTVHKLVMNAFDPRENYKELEVHHKDYNKLNNCLDNLEWTTKQQNLLYGSGPNELKILESLLCNQIKTALHKWYNQLLNVQISKECWTEEVVNNAIEQATILFRDKNNNKNI